MFLVSVRENIFTAQFLDAQELHSRSNWKFFKHLESKYVDITVNPSKKNFVQRCRKLLYIVGGLYSFLNAGRCLSHVKRFKVFHLMHIF